MGFYNLAADVPVAGMFAHFHVITSSWQKRLAKRHQHTCRISLSRRYLSLSLGSVAMLKVIGICVRRSLVGARLYVADHGPCARVPHVAISSCCIKLPVTAYGIRWHAC